MIMQRLSIKTFFAAALLFSTAACLSPRLKEHVLQGQAQGSTYRIVYIGDTVSSLPSQIDSVFKAMDQSLSAWVPESILSRLNQGDTIIPDAYFEAVFAASKSAYSRSGGYFDPSVGPLVKAWGFSFKEAGPVPDSITVDSLKQYMAFRDLAAPVKGQPYSLPLKGLILDFNAIAQGYTVDILSGLLESRGLTRYMVEVGGEIRTKGLNKEDKPWRIGIDKPLESAEGRPLQVILKLSDKALATSGSYRKFRKEKGIRYSHAIDPLSGWPVNHTLLSVSVIGNDCASADAYATAFLIVGVERAKVLARELGLEAYFISDDGKGGTIVDSTPGFDQYILEDVFE
jgi:FAD:protein FMN transferase